MAGQFLEVGVCYERDGVPPLQYCKLPLSKTFLKEGSIKTFTDVKERVEAIILGRLPEGTKPKACVLEMYFACGAGAHRRVEWWEDVVAEEVEPGIGKPGVHLWVVISNDVPLERSSYLVESYSGNKTPSSPQKDETHHGAPQQDPASTPGAAAPPPDPSPANPLPGHITAEAEILSPTASSNESEVAASLERLLAGLSVSAPAASAAHPASAAAAASPPPQPLVTPPQTAPRVTVEVPAPRCSLPNTPATSEALPAAADKQDTPSQGPSAFGSVPNVPCPISDATRPIRKSQQATNQSLQPPTLKPQVFISHTKSDEDAGRRFAASTLRPALLHAGVSVFMDFDSIRAGEDWGWSLIDNAANSAVVVVVLSRSFLTRYWCMLELDLALNAFLGQRAEPGQGPSTSKHRGPVVIPVLYDDIVEDLQPEERKHKRVKLGKDVDLGWSDPQNALKLVAGFKSDNEKEWGQLVAPERWMKNIEGVVDRLQTTWFARDAAQADADWQLALRVTASVLAEIQQVEVVDENLVGFEDQLDELEKVVMQPRNGGWGGLWLYGMGLCGKTTMAALLFNKLACQFMRSAFVRIPFGATPADVAQCVPEALKRLGVSVTSAAPSTQLRGFASVTEKVLYVLDNVQSGTQLDELLPETWGAGSVVIVTSRCNAFDDVKARFKQVKHLFEWRRVHKLAQEPSRRVFRQAANIKYDTCLADNLQTVEDGILECCDGLPGALRVMGNLLDSTPVAEDNWKSCLKALKQGLVPGMHELQSILKESLSRQAPGFMELDMQMFLDVATILSGQDPTWARDMWAALYPDDEALVGMRLRELERRSLLHEKDRCLVMHRMLMNIGRGLCLHQQGELSKGCHGTRIWVEEGEVAGCSQAAKTGELRATDPSALKEVPVSASSMSQAAHMHVFWLDLDGKLRRYGLPQRQPLQWKRASKEDGHVQVLSAGQWVKEPQHLAVAVAASHDYKVDHSTLATPTSPSGSSGGSPTSESSNPDPSRPLGPPSSDSATKETGSSSQPPSSGVAPPAAAASLTASPSLATPAHQATGNTARKPSLHELVIRLAPQATVWVRDVEELEQLVLSACAPAMQGLNLTACWRLQELPASFEQLTGLQALDMSGCEQLAALSPSFSQLAVLQSLNLRHCKGLTALPESIGQLKMLKALDLSHCEQLASLPESFGQLAALQTADLSNCYALASLPKSFGSLACLETLYLRHCTQLAALPVSFGQLPALRALHLVGCISLAALPASFGQLTALKQMDLSDCRRMGTLPESFGRLRALHLQTLALAGCVQLTALPQSFGCQLTQLGVLDLRGCQHLVTLPETCTHLVSLRMLSLSGCHRLTELPARLGSLAMLECLDLSWCSRLASLPSSVGGLAALRALDFAGCIALEQLPDSFGELQQLQDLSLRWCQSLESLPTSFGGLTKLHRLDMWDCKSLKALPTDTFLSLTALQTLEVAGCTLLSELPLSPQAFASLQELHLAGCSHVARLPESVGGLATLRVLNLAGASALSALPESLGQLLVLELLDLSGCEQLVALPESLGQLVVLRVLLIRGCKMLASLPESFGSLGALKVLELVDCHYLQAPPEVFHSLQLNTLVIRDCPGIQVPAEVGTGMDSTGLSAATNDGLQLLQSFARWQLRPQVFLSCAAHDPDTKQFATSVLKAALEAAGLQVAMDYTSCEGGFQKNKQLVCAAANSAVVVPVLSQSYGQQYWCMLELDAARHSHSLLQVASNGAAAQPLVLPVFFAEPHEVIDAVHNWDDTGTGLQQLRAEGGLEADWDAAGLAAVVDAPRWEGNIAAMAEAAQHIRRTDCYDKERDLQLAQRVAAHAKQAMHATLAQLTGGGTAGPSEKERLGGVQPPVPAGGVQGPSSATTLPLSMTVESPPQPSTSEVADGNRKYGSTPLHEASISGRIEVVRSLLEAGANKDAADQDGMTPLHVASSNGNMEMVRVLLEAGANKDAVTKYGTTPLHVASYKGNIEVVRMLLEAGANAEAADQDGWPPLHTVSYFTEHKMVRVLLEAGANKDAVTKDGRTPLHLASSNGNIEVVRMLLEAGAYTEAIDQDGRTPLHVASSNGNIEVVRMLLEAGAYKEAADQDGRTPLHVASSNGNIEVVRMLLEAGAYKEAADQDWRTPLHVASSNGNIKVVRMLLEAGAYTEAADQGGWTPLHTASHFNELKMVRVLLKAGANKDAAAQDWRTPLHVASSRGNIAVVRILLEAGAKEAADKDGRTALEMARACRHTKVVELLDRYHWISVQPAVEAKRPQPTPTEAVAPTPPTLPNSKPLLFQPGSNISISATQFPQVSVLSSVLAKAGFKNVLHVAGALITTNPVELIIAIIGLVSAVDGDQQAVLYCKERVQRVSCRVGAIVPALEKLHRQLDSGSAASVDESVARALTATLVQLAQVVAQLPQLLPHLSAPRRGALKGALRVLKAQGYKEALDGLDAELLACIGQLTAVLKLSQVTAVVVQEYQQQEALQVARWQAQNSEDRRKDMAQLEGLVLKAVGGVEGLEAKLATQEGLLDRQQVQLQQVVDWLQGMHASHAVISGHLQHLREEVASIHEEVVAVRDTQADLGRKVSQVLACMMKFSSGWPASQLPRMLIARSSLTIEPKALKDAQVGGFGTVVQALKDGSTKVALKKFNHRGLGNLDMKDAIREATLLHEANHPNIVRCLGVVRDLESSAQDSLHGSLVMEWVGGGDLHHWLQERDEAPLRHRVQLAAQVAAGMRHLHVDVGVVHGDLKPQNVLLQLHAGEELPTMKICNFGLAISTQLVDDGPYGAAPAAYSPAYTSPERFRSRKRSKEDDVYAFGVLLYFIATSCTPFSEYVTEDLPPVVCDGVRPDLGSWVQEAGSSSPVAKQVVLGYCQLAQRCWDGQPDSRPDFEQICQELDAMRLQVLPLV